MMVNHLVEVNNAQYNDEAAVQQDLTWFKRLVSVVSFPWYYRHNLDITYGVAAHLEYLNLVCFQTNVSAEVNNSPLEGGET